MVAVAGPNSEAYISFLKFLTGIANRMTEAVRGVSPETMATMFKVITVFGTALVGLGAISLVALAGLPALIGAAVIAIGSLVALNWDVIKAGFSGLVGWIGGLASTAWQSIGTMFNGIGSAISGFIDKIWSLYDRVKGWLGLGGSKEAPVTPNSGAQPNDPNSVWGDFRRGWGDLKHKSMFSPNTPQPAKSQPISLSLNVDGRTLAQAISDQLESLYGFPTGAPSPDGVGRFHGGDHNYSSA
jgi:hypothetical protein